MPITAAVRRPAVVALAVASLAGGGAVVTATAAGASHQTLHLRALPNKMRFDKSRLRAHPGRVTIVMVNPSNSGMPHGIAVEGNGVDKDGPVVQPGHTSRLTVRLKKGTYTYYCPVAGHRAAGMKGRLVVR